MYKPWILAFRLRDDKGSWLPFSRHATHTEAAHECEEQRELEWILTDIFENEHTMWEFRVCFETVG